MKKIAVFAASLAASAVVAAAPANFAAETERYLAAHQVAGVDSPQGLLRLIGEPCGPAVAVDAAVQPRHKARKVRCWGTLMLPVFRAWGIDAEEFDPDAAERGDLPDVVFVTQAPNYSQGDVDMMFRAAAEGVHVVTLSATDQWSREIAKRLGYSYGGVLTIGPPANGGVEALMLLSDDGKAFSGYRYVTWSRVEKEYAASEKVIWNQEYVGASAKVFN